MRFKSIAIATIIFLLFIAAACSKKTISTTKPDDKKTDISEEKIEEIYLKEGFISDTTFRIVIVDCIEKSHETHESLNDKAVKRALASLQKYIIENNMIYDNNTRARLINLIENNSSFAKQAISCNKNNVYYLNIKKRNIKEYIDSLSRRR